MTAEQLQQTKARLGRGETHARAVTLARLQRSLSLAGSLWAVLKAQRHLGRRGDIAPSVRVYGSIRCTADGRISVGERSRFFGTIVPVELAAGPGATLTIGRRCSINYGVSIGAAASITIGDDCYIGQYSIINDSDYHGIEQRFEQPLCEPVVLEDRVWLGARVIVLKGVHIGHDAVIGAGSVVLKDVPPRTVSLGHPARVVRQF